MEIENAWFRPAVCYLVEVRGMSMKEVADMFGVYHQVFLCLINVLFLILGRFSCHKAL